MFTGIVETIGRVATSQLLPGGGDRRLRIDTGSLDLADLAIGDSICVSGACLTAVELPGDGFSADVSGETLACTVLGELTAGDKVNLEKSLTPSTRLGGHLVSGHVDGVGTVTAFAPDANSWRLEIEAPPLLSRYIAAKGSVCIDGVSLTVNTVAASRFALNIIPHTLEVTTIGDYRQGTRVNLEVDIIARYLERLLAAGQPTPATGVTEELLRDRGFIEE